MLKGTKMGENMNVKPRKRKRSTHQMVEAAMRKVMDEVEDELPGRQDIWTQFFEHYVDLVVKEEERINSDDLTAAASLADYALKLVEERWPTALDE
jgi:hypothetical protein